LTGIVVDVLSTDFKGKEFDDKGYQVPDEFFVGNT